MPPGFCNKLIDCLVVKMSNSKISYFLFPCFDMFHVYLFFLSIKLKEFLSEIIKQD